MEGCNGHLTSLPPANTPEASELGPVQNGAEPGPSQHSPERGQTPGTFFLLSPRTGLLRNLGILTRQSVLTAGKSKRQALIVQKGGKGSGGGGVGGGREGGDLK